MSTARPPQPLAVSQLAATTAITNIQYPLEQHLRRHIPIGQATMALVNKDDKEEDHVNRWTFIFDNNLLSVKMSTKDAKLVERLQMELQYRGALVISASRLPHFSQFVTFQRQYVYLVTTFTIERAIAMTAGFDGHLSRSTRILCAQYAPLVGLVRADHLLASVLSRPSLQQPHAFPTSHDYFPIAIHFPPDVRSLADAAKPCNTVTDTTSNTIEIPTLYQHASTCLLRVLRQAFEEEGSFRSSLTKGEIPLPSPFFQSFTLFITLDTLFTTLLDNPSKAKAKRFRMNGQQATATVSSNNGPTPVQMPQQHACPSSTSHSSPDTLNTSDAISLARETMFTTRAMAKLLGKLNNVASRSRTTQNGVQSMTSRNQPPFKHIPLPRARPPTYNPHLEMDALRIVNDALGSVSHVGTTLPNSTMGTTDAVTAPTAADVFILHLQYPNGNCVQVPLPSPHVPMKGILLTKHRSIMAMIKLHCLDMFSLDAFFFVLGGDDPISDTDTAQCFNLINGDKIYIRFAPVVPQMYAR